MNIPTTRVAVLSIAIGAALAAPGSAQLSEALVRAYLWPSTDEAFAEAASALEESGNLIGLDGEEMRRLGEWMRAGPRLDGAPVSGDELFELMVAAPGGREIPTLVRLPTGYTPDRQWPLMFAMHGGPPGSIEGAMRSSLNMVQVWAESAEAAGWIIASPAMVDVVSRDGRTQDRLPYEIFQPEEARAVIDAVRARFSVAPDRIVSTGISLGSNFSIAYASAHPDWFSGIVPVSTEGESREWLLRNLAPVPTYVLEGTQDQNIRGVGGPRAMDAIMTRLDYDLVYREFGDRAHEGFQEHYPDVLAWLEERPRPTAPREVIRAPHAGIVSPSRRVHWVEADMRQALVRARVTSRSEVDVTVRWASEVTVLLNDELVDLDRDVTIRVNGEVAHSGPVRRSARVALEEARRWNDENRVYAARMRVAVPTTASALAAATAFTEEMEPRHPEGTLSFWEMYAVRALEERFPSLGFEAVETPLPAAVTAAPEQVGLRVTSVEAGSPVARAGLQRGDVLLSFGGELFFAGRGASDGIYHWLLRELRSTERTYQLLVERDGTVLSLRAQFGLGPYRPPGE